ncbi:uncharacterized protein LOC110697396 [Chenopodium quinoa]|uniref:uncharacterized protein LOC110697396 n=1 Tax=Chenopodium quinoa TaxID=63459 RepID=UPI000B76C3AB|nr:uncharacterized protein LOC110697396 [Chenopodium quinoa]
MANSETLQHNSSHGINFNDPYYLSNGDHPGMQLATHVLTGSNFLNSSRTVRMTLIARNKLQIVDGTLAIPSEDSPNCQKWIRNDYMVMSWILNSIDKSIAESFMFVNSSSQLWSEISERFGHIIAPRLFELHRSLTSTQQENASIAEYFGRLKAIWDQLQLLKGFPDCTCGAMKNCSFGILKKVLENDQRNKLMQLLSGLNKQYDLVITNLLSVDTLPTVHKAYYTLQQVEQQNRWSDAKAVYEMSAFHVAKTFSKPSYTFQKKDVKKPKSDLFCDYCKKRGHLLDACFVLNGYPDWWNRDKVPLSSASKLSATVSNFGFRMAYNAANDANGILGKAPPAYGESSGFAANSGPVDLVLASAV